MQVGILKRVLEEVEKVMQEFRGMLYKSMEDPLLDLAVTLITFSILRCNNFGIIV
jgi:Exocyst complex component Sec5